MKRNWLRGLLLGVSLAFLVTGGVALAQGLMVEPGCFQCWQGSRDEFDALQPGYPYSYTWETCGWPVGEELRYTETFANGYTMWEANYGALENGCVSSRDRWGWTCEGDTAHHGGGVGVVGGPPFPEDFWGPMEICLESLYDDRVSANQVVCETILFAEDCALATFVPEPGSILLLSSGLAGLAGYATLRLRSGQALRRRSRE
jgi:hypothetical protein